MVADGLLEVLGVHICGSGVHVPFRLHTCSVAGSLWQDMLNLLPLVRLMVLSATLGQLTTEIKYMYINVMLALVFVVNSFFRMMVDSLNNSDTNTVDHQVVSNPELRHNNHKYNIQTSLQNWPKLIIPMSHRYSLKSFDNLNQHYSNLIPSFMTAVQMCRGLFFQKSSNSILRVDINRFGAYLIHMQFVEIYTNIWLHYSLEYWMR